jgi:hypothetical protein
LQGIATLRHRPSRDLTPQSASAEVCAPGSIAPDTGAIDE